ncbi:TPA: flagellar hook-basal body complex protein, partial [Escherichia coli]
MDHAIYTAMGAASQTLNQQAVTASNLANASTPGFRAQLNALRAVPVEGLSLPTRTLVTASTPGADMTPGKMDYTSRPLDVALQQDGWLAVQSADGSEVQRGDDGIFRLSAESQATRGPILQADPTLRVMSGVLEGSNVNAVAAMSDMIASARRFEMQMKVISSVDDNAGRA